MLQPVAQRRPRTAGCISFIECRTLRTDKTEGRTGRTGHQTPLPVSGTIKKQAFLGILGTVHGYDTLSFRGVAKQAKPVCFPRISRSLAKAARKVFRTTRKRARPKMPPSRSGSFLSIVRKTPDFNQLPEICSLCSDCVCHNQTGQHKLFSVERHTQTPN